MIRRLIAVVILLLASASAGYAAEALTKSTHVYKTVGDVPIQAEVHTPAKPGPHPVLAWFHGGALIVGNRHSVPKPLVDLAAEEGYLLVSFDYRLAPEVKLPAIMEDVRDALAWVRREGPEKLKADPARLVVAGGSAGGYITLMTGCTVEPRPTALVAYWGYGDVDGPWLSQPSEFYRTKTPLIADDEARGVVGQGVLTGTDDAQGKARGSFYRWLRQHGGWTREVTGFDPQREREQLDQYCPVRQVTSAYPPTLLVHGTADTDVPYERSVEMAAEFKAHGVPYEFITVPGAGHGLAGTKPEEARDVQQRVAGFIRRHLAGP